MKHLSTGWVGQVTFGLRTHFLALGSQIFSTQVLVALAGQTILVLIQFPLFVSQVSVVQKLLSSQFFGVNIHPAIGSQTETWHLF